MLHNIIQVYTASKKKHYCAFIDYKKAFDMVDRCSLWSKLIAAGINGKVLTVIYNLYHNAKSCVRDNNSLSEFFKCHMGVRQGENLSPLLFALYLNDFELSISKKFQGLPFLSDLINKHLSNEDVEYFVKKKICTAICR